MEHITEQLRELAVDISSLIPDPANARLHPDKNMSAIKASLRVYGQRKPIVVNKRNMVIEAGNGTYEAAKALGWSHIAAVLVDDDPTVAAGFSIADNRSAELAEWDSEALDKLMREVQTDDEELAGMMEELAIDENIIPDDVTDNDAEPQIDRAAELQKKWGIAQGQLWLIGEHRLLCGDSTKREDVERVMVGERAGLCFTSPPYAQQRDYKESSENATDWDSLMQGVFGNLPMADDGQVLVNLGIVHKDGEWWAYWDGWIEWMRKQGWKRFGWYVWDQGPGLPGDWNGRFAPSFEMVFHFNKQAVKPVKWVEKKEDSICVAHGTGMRDASGSLSGLSSPEASLQTHKVPDATIRVMRSKDKIRSEHPAVMPIGLPEYFAKSWEGIAYEPFSGSGTTFVAAQNLHRKCYGIEISPAYCAVILERMSTAFPELEIRQAV